MTLLVTDPLYLEHSAPGHVESPERVTAILDHFKAKGLLERLTPLAARDATVEEIALMHGRSYIEVVREVSARGGGWFDSDTYLNGRSFAAAVRAVGGVLAAVEALRDGRDRTALCLVRPPGHHALPERGMGFCLFNNVAIAARFLKRRVLIVDWDVHHGNGTQEMVEDDLSIWYLSTHRFPFYPGTGWEQEHGLGNVINIPLSGQTSRPVFLQKFADAVRRAAAEFKPDFLLVSCGFDAYEDDPIGGLNLKPEDYRTMTDVVCSLGIPVASALEGGYSLTGLGPCAEQHALGLLSAPQSSAGP
ncbi:MAG TPA: histone deacetylase [Planctomycetota bacterium]|nr:histone deacetylase [Planctomycetota bacterium]